MDEAAKDDQWQQWVREHAPKFLLFARQKSRSEADAQDLVQEAVLEASRRNKDSAPPPLALVFATIHRRAIDLGRSEERRAGREQAAFQPGEPWFDTSVEDREMSRVLQESLNRLSVPYREVVTLKLWGELTFAEVAQVMGLPPNTVASRYRYALAELKKLMKGVLA